MTTMSRAASWPSSLFFTSYHHHAPIRWNSNLPKMQQGGLRSRTGEKSALICHPFDPKCILDYGPRTKGMSGFREYHSPVRWLKSYLWCLAVSQGQSLHKAPNPDATILTVPQPCLACTSCNKRLDSYNLVEHDQQVSLAHLTSSWFEKFAHIRFPAILVRDYAHFEMRMCLLLTSKTCHVKTFGTVDLRHANLPDRDDVLMSPPRSPARAGTFSPKNPATPLPSNNGAPPLPVRNGTPPVPVFSSRPYSPVRPVSGTVTASQGVDPRLLNHDDDDWDPPSIHTTPAHTGRGAGGLPRTLALNHAMTGPARAESPTKETVLSPLAPMTPTSTGGSGAHIGGTMTVPLSPTRTGTRYGMALGGGRMSSPMSPTTTRMSWAGPGNPSCGKCGKTVYFAEQVRLLRFDYRMTRVDSVSCTGQGHR